MQEFRNFALLLNTPSLAEMGAVIGAERDYGVFPEAEPLHFADKTSDAVVAEAPSAE